MAEEQTEENEDELAGETESLKGNYWISFR